MSKITNRSRFRSRFLIDRIEELAEAYQDDPEFRKKPTQQCPECRQTGSHDWRCPNAD